ncbi:MAG: hypothetical protein ACE5E6_09600 [Phycisphaerae bacterium]
MTNPPHESARDDQKYHTYETAHIVWYVRAMWIGFWIAAIWYIIKFAIPSAKSYF